MFRILFLFGVSLLVSGIEISPEPTTPTSKTWSNSSCIMDGIGIKVNLNFSHENETIKTEFDVPIENITIASKSCNASEQNMTITWPCDKYPTMNNSLTSHFMKTNDSKKYALHHLELVLHTTNSNSPKNFTFTYNGPTFFNAINESFPGGTVTLALGNEKVGSLELYNVKPEAFKVATNESVDEHKTTLTTPVTTPTTPTNTSTPSTSPITPSTNTSTPSTSPITPTTARPIPPTPSMGNKWIITDNNTQEICIVLQMNAEIQLNFNYNNTMNLKKTIVMPVNTTMASGVCGKLEQKITLTWPSTKNETIENSMTLHFMKNDSKREYSLSRVVVTLAASNFANMSEPLQLVHNESEFVTGMNKSYQCTTPGVLNLMLANNATKPVGHLQLSKLQFEVFKLKNNTAFGAVENCVSDDVSDVVPIAVGCILAGLVVVVLIAYLVGRRRRRAAQGYASM